jgi:hypothetical protein
MMFCVIARERSDEAILLTDGEIASSPRSRYSLEVHSAYSTSGSSQRHPIKIYELPYHVLLIYFAPSSPAPAL